MQLMEGKATNQQDSELQPGNINTPVRGGGINSCLTGCVTPQSSISEYFSFKVVGRHQMPLCSGRRTVVFPNTFISLSLPPPSICVAETVPLTLHIIRPNTAPSCPYEINSPTSCSLQLPLWGDSIFRTVDRFRTSCLRILL